MRQYLYAFILAASLFACQKDQPTPSTTPTTPPTTPVTPAPTYADGSSSYT